MSRKADLANVLVIRIHKFSDLHILSSRLYLSQANLGELNLHRLSWRLVDIGCTEDQLPFTWSVCCRHTGQKGYQTSHPLCTYYLAPACALTLPSSRCAAPFAFFSPFLSFFPPERYLARDGGQFAGDGARCDTGWRWDDAPRFGGVEEWLIQGAYKERMQIVVLKHLVLLLL